MNIFAEQNKTLVLGRQGENFITSIEFPVKDWIKEFGEGTFSILHRRSADIYAYPVPTTRLGETLVWMVSESDVQFAGDGEAQVILTIDGKTAKSEIFKTHTLKSLNATDNPPQAWKAWVSEVLEARYICEQSVEKYPQPGINGNWFIFKEGEWFDTCVPARGPQGPQGQPGPRGFKGEQGEQGIRGEQGPRGYIGPAGPQGERGLQGLQGLQGPKGEQGIQGPRGLQGERGEKGDRGDIGPKGEQGIQGPVGPQGIQGPKGDPVDVRINGESIVTDGVAEIPIASNDKHGVFKTNSYAGVFMNGDILDVNVAGKSNIDSRALQQGFNRVLTARFLDYAVKASLSDSNSLVTWSDAEKTAARDRIGVDEAVEPLEEKLDALWKLSEGRVYDIVEQEETGVINPPKGAKYATVEDVRGKTEQDSTMGYQLLNFDGATYGGIRGVQSEHLGDGWIHFSGTFSESGYGGIITLKNAIPLDGTYTMSIFGDATALSSIFALSDSKWVGVTGSIMGVSTFTVTTDLLRISLRGQIGTTVDVTCRFMLEKGSTAHLWEPYTGGVASPNPDYPREIVSVDSFTVERLGKNLFGQSENARVEYSGVVFTYDSGTGLFHLSGSSRTFYPNILTSIKVPKGKYQLVMNTPTIPDSGLIIGIDGISKYVRSITSGSTAITFDKNSVITSVMLYSNNAENALDQDVEIMLVRDGADQTFEPYNVKAERMITPPRPLNRIGDVFDKADIENGVWEYTTNRDILSVTSNMGSWQKDGCRITKTDMRSNRASTYSGYCNLLKVVNDAQYIEGRASILFGWGDKNIYIHVADGIHMTLDTIKQWITENEPQIVYILDVPTYETISDSDLEFLRSLENLPASDNIIVTDNHGRDVSYLVEYIRKLSEVS